MPPQIERDDLEVLGEQRRHPVPPVTVGRQRVEEERRPQLRAAPAVHLKTKAVDLDRAGGAARHARRAHAPAKRRITWRATSSMERSTCLAHRTDKRCFLGFLAVRPGCSLTPRTL